MRKLAASFAVTALLAGLVGAASAAPQSVVLEFKGEPGQEMKSHTAVEFQMDMMVRNPETGEEVFALHPRLSGGLVGISRVLEVAENGDLTLQGQVESFNMSLDFADVHLTLALQGPKGGPPQLIKLPPMPIQAVMSKRGKLVALKGLEKLPIPPIPGPDGKEIKLTEMIQSAIEEFSQPRFPDQPVAVGDSWTWEITFDPAAMMEKMGAQMPPEANTMLSSTKFPVKCTSTLAGFEMVRGVECAKIVAVLPWKLEFPAGPGIMLEEHGETTVTTWFDYEAGQVARGLFEFGLKMRAGTPELALSEMEMSGRGESERR